MITFTARNIGNQPAVTITARDEEHLLQSSYLRKRYYKSELVIEDNKVFVVLGDNNQKAVIGFINK